MGLIFAPGETAVVEAGTELEAFVPALRARGHKLVVASLGLKANAVERVGGRWIGAADPRSEGVTIDTTGRVTTPVRVARPDNAPPE
jgi:gamma-glutamyltranspeptidase/glutathione hydrolase